MKRSLARPLVVGALSCAAAITFAGESVRAAPSLPRGARLRPTAEGRFGVWLMAGPFFEAPPPGSKPPKKPPPLSMRVVPEGVDEGALAPAEGASLGAEARKFVVAVAEGGGIDLKGAVGASPRDRELFVYAAGVLETPRPILASLFVTGADGLTAFVDGREVLAREAALASGDEDIVPVRGAAGSHVITLKIRVRDNASLRTRLVASDLRAPPDVTWTLPGVSDEGALRLAGRLAQVGFVRGVTPFGYEPRATVRFPDGLPSPPPSIAARLVTPDGAVAASAGPTVARESLEVAFAPVEGGPTLDAMEEKGAGVEVTVAGRSVRHALTLRRATRLSLRRALFALAATPRDAAWLKPGSFASVEHMRRRLADLVDRGDADLEAQQREAAELDDAASRLEQSKDPFDDRTGFLRRAYRSPVDDELSPYALHVPAGYREGTKRRYPLIVALHGLNGRPMAMLRWFFGGDDPKRDQDWEERHTDGLPPLDAFVVAPNGHGNTMYRQLGQDDVLRALDEVTSRYPIDTARVTITGPSMGGIGAAALAFRAPDRFAAAAPLCGYHSVFVRRDLSGKTLRSWEKFLAEERSNVSWAENGHHTPLFIVHGTEDLPMENSLALVDRYKELRFPVELETPKLGHNVWQPTYEDLRGAKWLLPHVRSERPRRVRFRTARARDGRVAWVNVSELERPDAWAEIDAELRGPRAVSATTSGAAAIAFDRERAGLAAGPLQVTLDGSRFTVPDGAASQFHRDGAGRWTFGPRTTAGLRKADRVTGPLRDAFHEPLLFVYGVSDPAFAAVNEEVARSFARIRWGVDVSYPMMSDEAFFARGESLANGRALFLVGGAVSNRVVRALADRLPIEVRASGVFVGGRRAGAEDSGAAFVYPNPERPDRYVVVVAGATPMATYRALSLPDLLPDFVVFDERLRAARGQLVLGPANVAQAGFFTTTWALPPGLVDRLPPAATP